MLRDVRHGTDPAVRRPRRPARLHIQFWAADWTPWPVFAVLRERYPTLTFDVRPEYGDG
jgi:hypothetical protein